MPPPNAVSFSVQSSMTRFLHFPFGPPQLPASFLTAIAWPLPSQKKMQPHYPLTQNKTKKYNKEKITKIDSNSTSSLSVSFTHASQAPKTVLGSKLLLKIHLRASRYQVCTSPPIQTHSLTTLFWFSESSGPLCNQDQAFSPCLNSCPFQLLRGLTLSVILFLLCIV